MIINSVDVHWEGHKIYLATTGMSGLCSLPTWVCHIAQRLLLDGWPLPPVHQPCPFQGSSQTHRESGMGQRQRHSWLLL